MSHIRVLICRVEEDSPEKVIELSHLDLPETDISTLQPQTTLDALEERTQKAGNVLLQRLVEAQWEEVDAKLTQQTRQAFPPSHL